MLFPYRPSGKIFDTGLSKYMRIKPTLLVFSCVSLVGAAFFFSGWSPFRNNDPEPHKEAVLVRALTEGLARLHYQPKPIDDDFSKEFYKTYLKDIDNGKRFLTQADITKLSPFDTQLDDQIKAGNYDFFNQSVVLLEAGLVKTQGWYREILAKPIVFTKDETLETDGDKVKWAKDDADLRQRWEKWMKYEVLSRVNEELDAQEKADFKGTKKTFETLESEARTKLLDVYDKWYKRMQKMDRKRRLDVYLNAITSIFDPHTNYFSPREKENFDIGMSGKLEGIGARLQSDGEKTTVSEIVTGGPAWKQGDIQAKDAVIKVAQGDGEAIDVMGWDLDDVVAKIRGPKGTLVKLTIQKPDGTVKVVPITRDVVIMEEGFAKSLILQADNSTDKIGYIYLPKFYADFTPQGLTSCAADVAKEIEKLKAEGSKGLILDLRNNGGGSLRDVVTMSGLFVEQGPIVQVKSRNRKPEIMEDNDNAVQWDGALIVMVNHYSASASEILAAAMQDYGRALIVGAAGTYGKGTVQRFFDLDNATADNSVKPLGEVKLSVQKFFRITGKTTQLDGVKPDIVLPDAYNLVERGESENDYPLAASTIDAVPFSQKVYALGDINKLREASNGRVKTDPVFQQINEQAQWMKKRRDQTQYPLQAEKYRSWNKQLDDEAKHFEHMFKPIAGLTVKNLNVDMATMKSDTSKSARNTKWLEERQKDIQLYETMRIMQDMLRVRGVAVKQ
jgi:carboxyl-terminal processing protease